MGLWVLCGLLSVWWFTSSASLTWDDPVGVVENLVTLAGVFFIFGGFASFAFMVGVLLIETFSSWMTQ
jgi:hypothetical protein